VIGKALADVASLGPYFAVSTDAAEGAEPGWRPFPAGLDELIEVTGKQIGTGEPRVAASTMQLGLAARLWSPVVACALLHEVVPSLAALRQRGRALWLAEVCGHRTADPVRPIYRSVVEEALEPLNAAVREQVRISPALLWGNAASALVGTLQVLAQERPELAGRCRDLAIDLLATGRLRGTGMFTGPGLTFQRRSCCLYYRVPGGGLCGDCCLTAVPS
jgi:FhuF-like iron-sulfur protein